MEYNSQLELFKSLIPAFNVKKRLQKYEKYSFTEKDIWLYLANSKWRYATGLTIADMANDIITLDLKLLTNHKEGEQ